MRRAIVTATLALALSACGSTPAPAPPRISGPSITVTDAILVTNRDGSATLSAEVLNRATQTDELVRVRAEQGGRNLRVRRAVSAIRLFTYDRELLGTANSFVAVVENPGAVGTEANVTLEFSTAEPITVTAPVVARTDEHEEIVEGRVISVDVQVNPALSIAGDRVVLGGTATNDGDGALLATPTFIGPDGKTFDVDGPTRSSGPQGVLVPPGETVDLDVDGPYSIAASGLAPGSLVTVRIEWFNGVAGIGIRPTEQTVAVR